MAKLRVKRAELPVPAPGIVVIHALGGLRIPLIAPEDAKRKAMQWAYIVRNRIRWAADPTAFETVRRKALHDLASFGLTEAQLQRLGDARLIEVEIPFVAEDKDWELRILPWEFLLSAASGRPVVIVRQLHTADGAALRVPRSVGIVASLPGDLKQSGYEFDSEIALVRSNLQLPSTLWRNPTFESLQRYLHKNKPDVVHLAGVDVHEGNGILNIPEKREERTKDGYFLADRDGACIPVYSQELASGVTDQSKWRPSLVACNFYNSGSRTAPLLVAAGADAAIGFQDEIDNIVAEEFFTIFYRVWRTSNWDLLHAFDTAVQHVTSGGGETGSGITLWSSQPLVDATLHHRRAAAPKAVKAKPLDLSQDLILAIDPVESINYSLLHNEQSLFRRFTLTNANGTTAISAIRLYVELCVGDQTYPFRTILDLPTGSLENLTDRVRIPLTSTLFRSLRESVRSVLFVRVSQNTVEVKEQTYPVRLLAIDEWLDTEQLNAFLPSFVLSRDPAVLRVIDAAQKHLQTLTDDPGAGFDGYQSVDRQSDNPSEPVDLQVWAIWSALTYDFSISYINPPPSFEESSQRLRSPSDVIDGRRGTCIDLTLLLCACLEYIGIYPTIFLLEGHAFPGYWRSEQSREKFFEVGGHANERPEKKHSSSYAWVELKQGYDELLELIRCEDLSPIESVWLTQHRGFWEARDAGMEDLRDPKEFQAMIDVQRAREKKVTPLPVVKAL